MHHSLDDIATLAGPSRHYAIDIDLRVLFEGIFPALLKVDRGILALIFGDEPVNKVRASNFIDEYMMGKEPTLAERRRLRARQVDCNDNMPLVCKRYPGSNLWTADHPILPEGAGEAFFSVRPADSRTWTHLCG